MSAAIKQKKKEMTRLANLTKGFVKENPIFVSLLGMCPALAVTSTLETSIGMGLLVVFVLTLSNIVVALVKNLIPPEVKIPSYIVIIATFVTIVRLLTEAFAPALFESLGIFIPLIVVNCLILGRAEAFASKNNVLDSTIDGFGMALGFMGALALIGLTREVFGSGGIGYGIYLPLPIEGTLLANDFYLFNMAVLAGPAGGFMVIGIWLAIFNHFRLKKEAKIAAERQKMIEEKKRLAAERKKQEALESAGA